MLYLTCTTISSVDLAQYGVALAEDWVSVECGTFFYEAPKDCVAFASRICIHKIILRIIILLFCVCVWWGDEHV